MIEIKGRYNTAKIFTENVDEASKEQILTLCDQSFTEGSLIRLMPDVHAGAGCTIGTTMTIKDKIVPNLVGVDIGCGMESAIIAADNPIAKSFDPKKLDKLIYSQIPCGRQIRNRIHDYAADIPFDHIRSPKTDLNRARRSIGTLGGGNHFIEAGRDDEKNLYIVIHSGSRHLGLEIANYYQGEAWKQLNAKGGALKSEDDEKIPKALAFAEGGLFDDYINDMKITQHFAMQNRKAMMEIICNGLGINSADIIDSFTTVHNYIDTDSMILRKGAVSAKLGERLLIPMNMRDGSLLCEGLGNPDWNYSAPHGAGRIMSRKKAFAELSMQEFIKSMEGIYSSTVNNNTLDESPMAYKSMEEIASNIGPSAKVIKVIKPLYNFKAAE
jgi:RNA-splicing ligase RtcB